MESFDATYFPTKVSKVDAIHAVYEILVEHKDRITLYGLSTAQLMTLADECLFISSSIVDLSQKTNTALKRFTSNLLSFLSTSLKLIKRRTTPPRREAMVSAAQRPTTRDERKSLRLPVLCGKIARGDKRNSW